MATKNSQPNSSQPKRIKKKQELKIAVQFHGAAKQGSESRPGNKPGPTPEKDDIEQRLKSIQASQQKLNANGDLIPGTQVSPAQEQQTATVLDNIRQAARKYKADEKQRETTTKLKGVAKKQEQDNVNRLQAKSIFYFSRLFWSNIIIPGWNMLFALTIGWIWYLGGLLQKRVFYTNVMFDPTRTPDTRRKPKPIEKFIAKNVLFGITGTVIIAGVLGTAFILIILVLPVLVAQNLIENPFGAAWAILKFTWESIFGG